jgi:hypothetical protein
VIVCKKWQNIIHNMPHAQYEKVTGCGCGWHYLEIDQLIKY